MPITLAFNYQGLAYGWIQFTDAIKEIPNLQEYFIAPSAIYDPETKTWKVKGYSFVHVSHLPTEEQLKEKMKGVTG